MGQKTVVIYTRDWCSYCRRAKRLLKRKGYAFEEINMTSNPEGHAWLACTTGRDTVPQVFVEDRPIGGFDDVKVLTASASLTGWYGSSQDAPTQIWGRDHDQNTRRKLYVSRTK